MKDKQDSKSKIYSAEELWIMNTRTGNVLLRFPEMGIPTGWIRITELSDDELQMYIDHFQMRIFIFGRCHLWTFKY